MTLESFFQKLKKFPENIEFNDTMSVIDSLYVFTPTSFKNGDMAPHTNIGKAIAMVIMVMGYGILAVPTGIVTAEITKSM